jgi:cell division protein FtsL
MGKILKGDTEYFARKAFEETPPQVHTPNSNGFREARRPMIYNGSGSRTTSLSADQTRADVYTPRNRRPAGRKVSPFNVVVLLFAAAVVIVLYISNIIAVDQLMNDINALQNQRQRILMEQEILKAQINRLSSMERIRQKAEEDLQLRNPKQPPEILPVDRDKIEELEQALRQSQR